MVVPILPLEVVCLIIDQFIPSPSVIALESNHLTTRTLHSLTLTCRAISPVAKRLLLTHCLHIDSPTRLQLFLSGLASNILPLSNFVQSLYLAPFPDTLNDLKIAQGISQLFSILAPTLKRLVIDIPLTSLNWNDDTEKVLPLLESAFMALEELEVVCSLSSEFYISHTGSIDTSHSRALLEAPVWAHWPKLKILALYEQDIAEADSPECSEFWRSLNHLAFLETIVLTRPSGLCLPGIRAYWKKASERSKPLTLVLVDVDNESSPADNVNTSNVIMKRVHVLTSYYGDEDVAEICQSWTKRRIMRGGAIDVWE
jgi:hypothetical protein